MSTSRKANPLVWVLGFTVVIVVSLVVWNRYAQAPPANPAPQPVVMAFLGPLTGDAASFGVSQRRGLELAAEDVSAAGGIWNRPVRLVFEDTQLDQNKAIAAFNKVVDSDGATVVFGETSSANTLAIGPLAQRRGTLLISPLASAANVTSSGFRIFRISPSDTFQARIAAQFALESGWKSAAVIYTNDEWGEGLSREFAQYYRANGGTVTEVVGAEPRAQDFRPQLTRLRSAAPAVVYIPLHPDEAAVALKQARQLGIKTQFLGADSFSEPTIVATAGAAANGVIYTLPGSGTSAAFEEFGARFKAKFGEAANYNSAAAFDALKLVADAAKRAAQPTVSGLVDALAKTSGYQGASGSITFDSRGDVTSKAFEIRKLDGGQSVVVKSNVALTAR